MMHKRQEDAPTLLVPQAATTSLAVTNAVPTLTGTANGVVTGGSSTTSSNADTISAVVFAFSSTSQNSVSSAEVSSSVTSRTTATDGAVMTTVYVTTGRAQPTQSTAPAAGLSSATSAGIGVGVGLGVLLLALLGFFLWRKRARWGKAGRKEHTEGDNSDTARAELSGEGKARAELEVKDVTYEIGAIPEARELHGQPIRAELEADWERREVPVSGIR